VARDCVLIAICIVKAIYYTQTVIAFPAKATISPDFEMAPATQIDKVIKGFASETVVIDDQPEFSKRYWLRSREGARLRALFNPGLVAKLAMLDPGARWSIEKAGDWLLIYIWKTTAQPGSIRDFCVQTDALASLFV